jgi:hypothetical protein
MGFERIVRPYETGDGTPPTLATQAGFAESNAPVRLRPGLVGRPKSFHADYSSSTTVYVIKKPQETQS